MIKPIPRWLQKRYAILWKKFKEKNFNFETAKKTLKDKQGSMNVAFSELRKLGWITIGPDPKDARKRIYKLEPLEKAFEELAKKKK